jgi:N-acetylglucosamine-6-phosphate deacetylase
MSTASSPGNGWPPGRPFALVGRLLGIAGEEGDQLATVTVDGGKIVAIERLAVHASLPEHRLQAAFIAPGFVDLQVNGGFGFEVGGDPDALRGLAARLPETGVTSFLPTLVSRSAEEYREAFAAFEAARRQGGFPGAARVLGLHLEGPLLALGRAGAHWPAAIEGASAAMVDELADPTRVRLVTLAPERQDALALIKRLTARGVVVSLGHTDASFETFTAGVDAGATLATHIFNAMPPFHHRAPGALGAALTDDRVVASLIADGLHTHPAALRLAVRAKGIDRIALVTDAIAGAGLPPGRSRLAGQQVTVDETSARLDDGTLAGSTVTLGRAVRNMIAFTGLPPAAAVRMATRTPALALGSKEVGTLAAGANADIVLLDQDLGVLATFVGGVLSYRRDPDDLHVTF